MNKPAFSRRKFITYSAYGVGAVSAGIIGFSSTGKVNYSDPAYLYWNKNTKGALENESYAVLCGALAASAHNTQPWRFDISDNQVDVYADLNRNLGKADADRRMMSMSVGCAIENITIAAQQLGITPEVTLPDEQAFFDTGFSARIKLPPGKFNGDHPMFPAIFQRRTTRAPYLDAPPSPVFLTAVDSINDFPDIQLHLFSEKTQVNTITDIHKQAVDDFVADDGAYLDSVRWWRYTREELLTKRDGISIFTSAAPSLIKHYFSMGVGKDDMEGEFGRRGEADLMHSLFDATPQWGLITASTPNQQTRLNGGRLLERLYLTCAQQDYRIMPVIYASEQPAYAKKLLHSLQLENNQELLSVVRIGQSGPLERSVRRPLSDIIV